MLQWNLTTFRWKTTPVDTGRLCGVFALLCVTTWCKSSMSNWLSHSSQADFVKSLSWTGMCINIYVQCVCHSFIVASWWWNYKTVFPSFCHRCFSVDKPKTAYFAYRTEEKFLWKTFISRYICNSQVSTHASDICSQQIHPVLCNSKPDGVLSFFSQSCLRTSSVLAVLKVPTVSYFYI